MSDDDIIGEIWQGDRITTFYKDGTSKVTKEEQREDIPSKYGSMGSMIHFNMLEWRQDTPECDPRLVNYSDMDAGLNQ